MGILKYFFTRIGHFNWILFKYPSKQVQRTATIFKHTDCKKGSMPMRLWSSSFRLFIMPRSRIRAQDHLWLISYVRIDVPGVALRDFVSVISLFLGAATMRCCRRTSSGLVMMPRSTIRAQYTLRLVSHVRIDVLGVAMRDFIGVISLFLSAATMRCCKRSSSGVATMPRSWIRAQVHFWLVYNVRIGVLGVGLRDFVSVIPLFLGAATMRCCRRTSSGLVMMPRSTIRAQHNLRLVSHV